MNINNIQITDLRKYLQDISDLLQINNTIYEEDLKIICKIAYENSINKDQIINGFILYIFSLITNETKIIYDDLKNNNKEKEINSSINTNIIEASENHFQQEEPYQDEYLNKLRILTTQRTRRMIPEESFNEQPRI